MRWSLPFSPIATILLLGRPVLVAASLAIVLLALGHRLGVPTLALHGQLLALLSAATGGLLGLLAWSIAAPAAYPWPPLVGPTAIALAAVLAGGALPLHEGPAFPRWLARSGSLLLLSLSLLGLAAMLLWLLAPGLAGTPGAGADPGILAVLRTAVLGLVVATAALLGRSPRFAEARWLVYPLLFLGGVKPVLEDFPVGRATTLFFSLLLYGGALILAPRLGVSHASEAGQRSMKFLR